MFKDIVDKRLMDLYTCNINPRANADENNKMYLFWTSTDDRVDKLDHFVPLMNDFNPPPLKQTKYVKREVYVPVTNSLLEGIFMDIGKKRSSPKEQEISCKKRKVCKVGNKQITATASMNRFKQGYDLTPIIPINAPRRTYL